jgi:hypothetical protein
VDDPVHVALVVEEEGRLVDELGRPHPQ